MKRLIMMAVGAGLLYTPFAFAQTTDTTNQTAPAAQQSAPAAAANANAPAASVAPAASAPAANAAAAPASTTATTASAPAAPAQALPPVDKGKVSYSIGVDLGENFKTQGIEVDPDMLVKGMKDAIAGNKLMLTKEEMANTLVAFQKQLVAKQQANFANQSSKNEQEGTAYAAANKAKPGVVTTASGLQYKVIDAGTGSSPKDSDVVTVDYSGTFINGKVFDSSYKRGKPVTFPVSEVIPGWVEAIKLMKPGATYEVVVPPALGYGDRGLGNVIGPKQTLLFKIHLISVKPAETKS